jgi:hypothetical protein
VFDDDRHDLLVNESGDGASDHALLVGQRVIEAVKVDRLVLVHSFASSVVSPFDPPAGAGAVMMPCRTGRCNRGAVDRHGDPRLTTKTRCPAAGAGTAGAVYLFGG